METIKSRCSCGAELFVESVVFQLVSKEHQEWLERHAACIDLPVTTKVVAE